MKEMVFMFSRPFLTLILSSVAILIIILVTRYYFIKTSPNYYALSKTYISKYIYDRHRLSQFQDYNVNEDYVLIEQLRIIIDEFSYGKARDSLPPPSTKTVNICKNIEKAKLAYHVMNTVTQKRPEWAGKHIEYRPYNKLSVLHGVVENFSVSFKDNWLDIYKDALNKCPDTTPIPIVHIDKQKDIDDIISLDGSMKILYSRSGICEYSDQNINDKDWGTERMLKYQLTSKKEKKTCLCGAKRKELNNFKNKYNEILERHPTWNNKTIHFIHENLDMFRIPSITKDTYRKIPESYKKYLDITCE